MLNGLKKILSHRKNFDIYIENNARNALERVSNERFDIIISDLKMEEVSGIEILKTALSAYADSTIIMMSGYGTIEASVEAMREGAFDFIEKPFTSQKLFECIDRALSRSSREEILQEERDTSSQISGIVYRSEQMSGILKLVSKVAPGNMNVLITGESGTGKEIIARAIHRLSKRSHNPFIPVNCGTLPENLFESELFGHEKGSFTGALKTKPGLLEFANSGTFFFDEIGEMGLNLQVKLLRMLEEHKIRRIGGKHEIKIDVRIIAATNRNLEQLIHEKKFREDLYYRLNTILITIPPLRERPDDILPLAHHFLAHLNETDDKNISGFSSAASDALMHYHWPGNVRELQNIIQRAYVLSSTRIIQLPELPLAEAQKNLAVDDELFRLPFKEAKEKILDRFEVEYLTHYLRKNRGNISQTALECGLDRRSIHRLINKYDIVFDSFDSRQ